MGDVWDCAWRELRRRKGRTAANILGYLLAVATAVVVITALRFSRQAAARRRERAKALLSELGLGGRMDMLPAELSVGQQQLVAIARALANEPALLVADEPTGDVDLESAQEIIRLLASPVRERGAALVVATHGAFPLGAADRVLYLREGALASPGAAGGRSQ